MVPDELLKFKGQPGFEYLDNFGHGTKQCCRCKEVKDTALFNKKKSNKDGLSLSCRECHKESQRKSKARYRERNAGKPKDPDYHKTCPSCGITKSSMDFHRGLSEKDGLRSQCKNCTRKETEAFLKNNPDYKRKHNERSRRKNTIIEAIATVSGRYSPEEDLVVLDNTLTAYQKAAKLSRTPGSVNSRRVTLKKKGITHVSNYPKI